jgi:hypothetical protein
LDSSDEAQRIADKLCEDLAVFPGETIRIVVDAKDPGSADTAEVEAIRKFTFGRV